MPLLSDDYSDSEIDPVWVLDGPAEGTAAIAFENGEAFLTISLPPGNFDLFNTTYNAARVLQDADDVDLSLEARFLSEPSARFQIQGILIEQDALNWIRFDLRSDGNNLKLFSAVTTDGSSSVEFDIVVPSGAAEYLRVTRLGDDWTMEYSADGVNFTTAGSFTHNLTVSAVGPFAASTGGAPGYAAQVDYFESASDPILDEDGTLPDLAPIAVEDALETDLDVALIIDIPADLLANDTDGNADPLSLVGFTQPANGALADNGNGTLTYTPDAGFSGIDSFTYTISDGALESVAAVSIDVGAEPFNAISDDFSDPVLNEAWIFSGIGGGVALDTSPTDAFAEIASPAGLDVSASDFLTTPRLLQSANDVDFQIRAGFLSIPQQSFQEHGLLIVEDDQNFIRFDLAFTSTGLRLIVGVVDGGVTDFPLFQNLGEVTDFRIVRDGDDFVFEASTDGVNFAVVHTGTYSINVTQVGVFAGSTGRGEFSAPGYTAQLDYFENAEVPILNEDAGVDNFFPATGDDNLDVLPGEELVIDIDADLIANDVDVDGDVLTLVNFEQPTNGVLTDVGGGELLYTPNADFVGIDAFSYTISDGNGGTASGNVTVSVKPPAGIAISDDFDTGDALDPAVWTVEGPEEGSGALVTVGEDGVLELTLPAGDFDIFDGNYNALRAMQNLLDEDFSVEAGFLSSPTERFQIQGLVFEQDDENWVRFDLRSDGTNLFLFAGITVDGTTSSNVNMQVLPGEAQILRVTRTGDEWLLEYSSDGVEYTEAGFFIHAMSVNEAGPFSASTGGAPGYTAQVSYFENTVEPIFGTEANDRLSGSSFGEVLDGLEGDDRYTGNGGSDLFVLGAGELDQVLDFELGKDKLDLSGWGTQNFSDLLIRGADGRLILKDLVTGDLAVVSDGVGLLSVADLTADSFVFDVVTDLQFIGTENADRLVGRAGNDVFDGLGGNDRYTGNAGRDLFILGAGDLDRVEDFEANIDTLDVSAWGTQSFVELSISGTGGRVVIRDVVSGDLTILTDPSGDLSADDLTAASFVFDDLADTTVTGTVDADRLIGRASDEVFDGLGGDDRYTGNGGSDVFVLGAGDLDRIEDFEIGIDTIDLSGWGTQSLGELSLRGSDGRVLVKDLITGDLAVVSDTLGELSAGDLTEDNFIFDAVTDLPVTGTPDADRLIGRAGNDVFDGLAGNDRYTGNGGSDVFRFGAGDLDRVEDFEVGLDLLDVSGWGTQNLDQLSVTGSGGRVVVRDLNTGDFAVVNDTTGDLSAGDLSAGDFVFELIA